MVAIGADLDDTSAGLAGAVGGAGAGMVVGLVDVEAMVDETLEVGAVDATEGGRESEGATEVDLETGADAGIGTAVGEGIGISTTAGSGAGRAGAGTYTVGRAGGGIDADKEADAAGVGSTEV